MSITPQSENTPGLRIIVLMGGPSQEREISLESGEAVAQALTELGHQITKIDPATDEFSLVNWGEFDAAFIALHGSFGEDGQIQTILEKAGIPFTGSSAEVAELTFHKSATKERLIQNYVPTPAYVLIHQSDDARTIQQHACTIGYPLVVKPDTQGSSLGVSIVHSAEELPQALTRCFQYEEHGLIEQAVLGTEWTVSQLDDTQLPLIQIETNRGFYDYEAKYQDEQTDYHFEFALPTDVVQAINRVGAQALETTGVEGVARVDIRLDEQQRPWVLEINTVPGFTSHSLVPMAAAKVGLSLGQLCDQSIRAAIRRSQAAVSVVRT